MNVNNKTIHIHFIHLLLWVAAIYKVTRITYILDPHPIIASNIPIPSQRITLSYPMKNHIVLQLLFHKMNYFRQLMLNVV